MGKKVSIELEIPDGKYCNKCPAFILGTMENTCFITKEELESTLDINQSDLGFVYLKDVGCPNAEKETSDENV